MFRFFKTPAYLKSGEKKVEYVELIYDLIFVFMIGRNNSLISQVVGGFIDGKLYIYYVLYTLITIQIWYLTTLFINRYGDNGAAEYICLFVNMFLLYYMGDGTKVNWQISFYKYNTAWLLILINLIIHYLIKYHNESKVSSWEKENILFFVKMLSVMAAIIVICIGLYSVTGMALSPIAMVAGVVISVLGHKKLDLVAMDFPHLTERVMLYIVFTFGEMIVSIAVYFKGEVTLAGTYLSLMMFLIVVGLFMSYGFLYDHLIDRNMHVSGNAYMIIHIFIIFALNNLTTAFEFMQMDGVPVLPKNLFLMASFVIYYVFIFFLAPFSKGFDRNLLSFKNFGFALGGFVILMAIFYRHPFISIAVSAGLTFVIWYFEFSYRKYLHEEKGI